MNDRHPSGTMTTPAPASDASSAQYASYGAQDAPYGNFTTHNAYDASGFSGSEHSTGTFATDPLFGSLPDDGGYDTGQWATGGHQAVPQDPYAAQHHAAYDTGAYDTTAWTTGYQHLSAIPPQADPADASGQWDASAWLQPDQATADATQQWDWGTQTFDTGVYDATQWNNGGTADASGGYEHQPEPFDQQATAAFDPHATADATATFDQVSYEEPGHEDGESTATGELPAVDLASAPLLEEQEEAGPRPSRAAARNSGRSRRRTPAKRSVLLTIAVPSACVMGVAGIATASVNALSGDDTTDTTASAADGHAVKPSAANNKLDTQLASLSAGADDFADRASRTQERIDLKAQQELERKKAAEEAERKERMRPKFALPVLQHGLSAYFGQAGINWMSVHTGIDFPVSYGTTVMAATDGVVRTQWNSAYGNMLILTAKDGTETWYCHLSSYRVSAGTSVKAGQPIAYSGNSGNSTGPHLHFEVRPGGGAAINPLPWLRSHGLDPS
ncbi:M23 family metallopeptidase [Streptomyces sp. NPDC014006]|uniref:M23 family metallopeptidase n=1 Tax=Streptomyces sp. NPDC014006 TaxID=3364870 RepID=UPI0036F9961A